MHRCWPIWTSTCRPTSPRCCRWWRRWSAVTPTWPSAPAWPGARERCAAPSANEYVMLSAHFDSWDAGSGATDNGTGTITMLEAMRILKTGVSASEAHDSRRPLERRGGGRDRLVGVRRGSSGGPEGPAGAVQSGQRHGRDRQRADERLRRRGAGARALDGAHAGGHDAATSRSCCPASRTTRARTATPSTAATRRPSSSRRRLGVRRLHVAHQPRHVRQDRLRRSQAERDARRDVRLSGVGGSDVRVTRRGASRRPIRAPANRRACRSARSRHAAGRRRSVRKPSCHPSLRSG